MSAGGDLDYALARLAARRARRPGPATWRALESLRAFAPALAAARNGGLVHWLDGIDARSDPHRIEAALRAAWRAEVAALARWLPARWQPALAACADWIDLPRLRAIGAAEGADKDLARLHASLPGGHRDPDAAWQALLLARLCEAGAVSDPAFARLARALTLHRERFAVLPPGNGWPLRADLDDWLLGFLHTAPPGPATAFAWVALQALEIERVRGVLLPRAAREAAA